MKYTTIYELKDWDIAIKFGEQQEDIDGVEWIKRMKQSSLLLNYLQMTNEIPQDLIIKALALTGKSIEDMKEVSGVIYKTYKFSYTKFFYYLLSPEFIEKYRTSAQEYWYKPTCFLMIWEAIYEYQKGNNEPIISLLSKI